MRITKKWGRGVSKVTVLEGEGVERREGQKGEKKGKRAQGLQKGDAKGEGRGKGPDEGKLPLWGEEAKAERISRCKWRSATHAQNVTPPSRAWRRCTAQQRTPVMRRRVDFTRASAGCV